MVASRPVRRILSGASGDVPGRPSLSADGYPPALAAHPGVFADGQSSPCLALLPVGFVKPPGSPRALVRSYRTVSPLPVRLVPPSAVCSLWHFPAGHPDWVLPSTVPCGVRTFLGPVKPVRGRLADSPPRSVSHGCRPGDTGTPRAGSGGSGPYALGPMAVPAALTRAEARLVDDGEPLRRAEVDAVAALPLDALPDLIALPTASGLPIADRRWSSRAS